MTTVRYKQKFPCGYELDLNVSGFGLRDFTGLPTIGLCPIHGVKCTNNIKSGEDRNE